MTIIITFSSIGADAGPFNLYSNVDGYASPFAIGVTKIQLLTGYSSDVVPDGTTIVRAKSTGVCTNYVDLVVTVIPTTTTTSSTTIAPTTTTSTTLLTTTTTSTTGVPTTTTSTTPPSTTTTTTTAPPFNANLTFTTFTTACSNPLNAYAYQSTDDEGTHYWSNIAMTIPINSSPNYFRVGNIAIKTSGPNGVVTGAVNCGDL